MPIEIEAAERFMLSNARVLERHHLAVILHGAPTDPVLDALRPYRNADGGFGHALEPDVRGPESEPVAVQHALEVLLDIDATDDPMLADAAAWLGTIADADGGMPFVLPAAARYPRAPWMVPSDGGSQITFSLAAYLWEARSSEPWLERATEWCWRKLEGQERLTGFRVKFALDFLDAVPDEDRARAAVERLRSSLGPDGSVPVPGGIENERITPLMLSERPEGRSRALFTDEQIAAELDALEAEQRDDGGWMFDWLAWSPGQEVEWRGIVTVRALRTLGAHGRLDRSPTGLLAG
jgi:hypothetical protein